MKLTDKVAVVTGGSRGMGRAIGWALSREGAAVAVNYSKSQEEAEAVVRSIVEAGGRAFAFQADVAVDAECRTLMEATKERWGRLDLLVNNAGYTQFVPHRDLHLLTDDLLQRVFAVNALGPLYCSRAAIPLMLENGGGSIVNITSVAGITGGGSSIIYSAAKGALTTMTKSLARAFAPEIRVNAVAPGFVDTNFADWPADTAEKVRKANHIGRLVDVQDVAEAVLFLATEGGALTGQEIVLDGGMIALGSRG
jgi:3-oxoacyl-[acyl-carrier protein] reductase